MINFSNLMALYPGRPYSDLSAEVRKDWDMLVDIAERLNRPLYAAISFSAFESRTEPGTFIYHTYVSYDGENFERMAL